MNRSARNPVSTKGEGRGDGLRLRSMIVIFYALAFGVVWAIFCFIVFVVLASNAAFDGRGLTALVISILPLVVIWVATTSYIRSFRAQNAIQRLNATVHDLRELQASLESRTLQLERSTIAHPPGPSVEPTDPEEQAVLQDVEPDTPDTEDISLAPDLSRAGTPAPTTYLDLYDMPAATLIQALNFADNPGDQSAFEAIETAMQNPELASLMGRAHTILLGLAEIDVITDELAVDFSEPHFWRISASTLTDKSLLMLGEIVSHPTVDAVSRMMGQNHDFVARVKEFIERAMPVIRYLAGELNDAEIELLTETRCIRALVLVRQAMEQP